MPYIGKKPADIIATAVDTTTGTFSGDLTVDTSTLYVDSANNRVGIGTSSPTAPLHIQASTTPYVAFQDGTNYLNVGVVSSNYSVVNSSLPIAFQISNSEKVRIDASGNLLVGTTDINPYDNTSGTGIALRSSGAIYNAIDGGTPLVLNRMTNDGTIAQFRQGGTIVGSIGSVSGATAYIDGGSGFSGIQFGGDGLVPRDNGAVADNTSDLGTSSQRFKDLYLSGNAGVGANPSSFNAGANNLVVGTGSGSEGISIYAGNSSNSAIFFADTDSTTTGQINYQHASNAFTFHTNGGTERMRIDSSGNLLVGTTNANPAENNVAGIGALANNTLSITRDGSAAMQLNRKTSDGSIAIFRKDGSTVGSIGTFDAGYLYIASPRTTDAGIKIGTSRIVPSTTTGADRDGAIDLGYSSGRWKDLYLSGGAYLGGTGSANYLSDYEEGTFSPILQASVSNPTVSYGSVTGAYTKVGRLVKIDIYLITNSYTGGSGTIIIGGLPFACASAVNFAYSTGSIVGYKVNTQAEAAIVIVQGSSQARILTRSDTSTSGTWNYRSIGDWTNGTTTGIQASLSYVTDS